MVVLVPSDLPWVAFQTLRFFATDYTKDDGHPGLYMDMKPDAVAFMNGSDWLTLFLLEFKAAAFSEEDTRDV